MNTKTKDQIKSLISNSNIFLFMKGSKNQPQCGFSKQVIDILNHMTADFDTFDILSNPEIREGIKEYSSWPTIPQLYINQEFIGGCDIIKNLYASKELHKLLNIKTSSQTPEIIITPEAAQELKKASQDIPESQYIRLSISADFSYALSFTERLPDDIEINLPNIPKLILDALSATRAHKLKINYVHDQLDSGFSFENPNEPENIKDLSVEELDTWHKNKQDFMLIDVRPKDEWEQAHISFAQRLEELDQTKLDKNFPIVFQCHHGGRSMRMAEKFRARGFNNLYNLVGGIDAWSRKIDQDISQY